MMVKIVKNCKNKPENKAKQVRSIHIARRGKNPVNIENYKEMLRRFHRRGKLWPTT